MERGRYNGYRRRSGTQTVLMAIISVLAVLVVLVAAVLLLGQRYIYYGADGVHLDLPFMTRDPAPAPDVDRVVVEVLPPEPKEPETAELPEGDISSDLTEDISTEQTNQEPVD